MTEQRRYYLVIMTKGKKKKIDKLITYNHLQDISIFEILAGKNNDKLEEMDNYLDNNRRL